MNELATDLIHCPITAWLKIRGCRATPLRYEQVTHLSEQCTPNTYAINIIKMLMMDGSYSQEHHSSLIKNPDSSKDSRLFEE